MIFFKIFEKTDFINMFKVDFVVKQLGSATVTIHANVIMGGKG